MMADVFPFLTSQIFAKAPLPEMAFVLRFTNENVTSFCNPSGRADG
jgi:hypothetical protein